MILAFNKSITDFAEVYWWDNIEAKYEKALCSGDENMASLTDSIKPAVEADLKKVIEFFGALD